MIPGWSLEGVTRSRADGEEGAGLKSGTCEEQCQERVTPEESDGKDWLERKMGSNHEANSIHVILWHWIIPHRC